MDKLNQPITQNKKLRPNWGGGARYLGVHRGGKEGGVSTSYSPPLGGSLLSMWKENPNPALFVSLLLGFCPSFHGNWLWTPRRKVAPCGDYSDFPFPGPSLKQTDSSPCALGRGHPERCSGTEVFRGMKPSGVCLSLFLRPLC